MSLINEKTAENIEKMRKKTRILQKNDDFSSDQPILEDGERFEDLQCKGLKIIQNKNYYTFSADSVLLANFVKTNQNDVCVEIGAGSGVVSILVNAKNRLKKIYAFELQKEMCDLCEKNIKLNKLQEQIEIIEDNIKNFQKFIKRNSVDVVFSNPPYFKPTDFSSNKVRKIAREEIELTCSELCEVASKILRSGGAFYVCYNSERSCELIYNLQKNNLAVKQMFFTENGRGKVQTVFIKAVKDGNFGTKVEPNLVTNDEQGNYLDALHTKYFC